jgi:hypothetical protein
MPKQMATNIENDIIITLQCLKNNSLHGISIVNSGTGMSSDGSSPAISVPPDG